MTNNHVVSGAEKLTVVMSDQRKYQARVIGTDPQTDASINPGNSGDALADLDGNVIGINTAITSPSGGKVGIGFAIPINMAKNVMTQLMKKGKIARGYLAQQLGYQNERGGVVTDVISGSPAEDAGIQQGDLIKEINRVAVSTAREFNRVVARLGSGDSVTLLVRRGQNTFYVTIQMP